MVPTLDTPGPNGHPLFLEKFLCFRRNHSHSSTMQTFAGFRLAGKRLPRRSIPFASCGDKILMALVFDEQSSTVLHRTQSLSPFNRILPCFILILALIAPCIAADKVEISVDASKTG